MFPYHTLFSQATVKLYCDNNDTGSQSDYTDGDNNFIKLM